MTDNTSVGRALRVPPTPAGVVPFWLTLLTSCFDTMPMPLYGGAGLVSGLMMPSRLCSAGPGFRRRVRSGCDDRLLKLIRQHLRRSDFFTIDRDRDHFNGFHKPIFHRAENTPHFRLLVHEGEKTRRRVNAGERLRGTDIPGI